MLTNGQPFERMIKYFGCLFGFVAVFEMLLVLGLELVNTTSGINKFDFSGIERMRSVRNFKFHQRVFFAVFPHN